MQIELPPTTAIMALPGATLFPHSLMPLYIFEPRYRKMIQDVLKGERMFSIAMIRPQAAEALGPKDFHSVGTIGLIRACVSQPGGCSNLVLQGLVRVRFTEFLDGEPYCQARIEHLPCSTRKGFRPERMREKIVELCAQLQEHGVEIPCQMEKYLQSAQHPADMIDVISYNFLSDPQQRQEILEETSLAARLRLLRKYVEKQFA